MSDIWSTVAVDRQVLCAAEFGAMLATFSPQTPEDRPRGPRGSLPGDGQFPPLSGPTHVWSRG
ncbi:hypothetical protein KC973_00080 [Candidatus Saccharibacteria bacterium]|nr:hypothetical protein [Candidatus Saccharibacteria bacterium]